jgi:hypothetical protein
MCSCTGLKGELLKRLERGVVDLISMASSSYISYRFRI